jgi:lysophospholipase L1-like esterase
MRGIAGLITCIGASVQAEPDAKGEAIQSGDSQRRISVALIGDSTVTEDLGWGQAFANRFNDDVLVRNFAVPGRSSKSWYDEKRLPEVLALKPNYVLIQFGHNGQPGKGPARETAPDSTYRDYLTTYVNEFRKVGAKPIIVSSVTRRNFDDAGKIEATLTPWARAAEAVAEKLGVPFVDLHTASVNYHNKIGREQSMTFNKREGDTSHLNGKGAEAIAELVIKELKTVCPDLHACIKHPVEGE